jgi:hypothetical protein
MPALKQGPKGAIPTSRGWINPKTGELLKAQKITQEQLDQYNGVQMITEPAPVVEEELIIDYEPTLFEDMPEVEVEVEEETPKAKKNKAPKKKVLGLFG